MWNVPGSGMEPVSPALAGGFFTTEPPGKPWLFWFSIFLSILKLYTIQFLMTYPKNTGVGSHCPLQGIFSIQGSNLGLLHCKRILYHLSHQGQPGSLDKVRSISFRNKESGVRQLRSVIAAPYSSLSWSFSCVSCVSLRPCGLPGWNLKLVL